MAFDWSTLRQPSPATLVPAREVAHYALTWIARAATANVPPVPDDSHTALLWSEGLQALMSQPMQGGIRAGLRVAALELVVNAETCALEGRTAAEVDQWLDAKLASRGLKPASAAKLPYAIPAKPFRKVPGLAALARWFAAGADVLEEIRTQHAKLKPSPAWVWPHHFDMATLITLSAYQSIGIGISPGDHHYAQPYVYVSPYPAPGNPNPAKLPPGGHWHTREFFGAVATADALLAQREPRAALIKVIEAALPLF